MVATAIAYPLGLWAYRRANRRIRRRRTINQYWPPNIHTMGLIGRVIINAIAIAIAAALIPGISYGHTAYGYGDADKWISLVLTALVLGVVNAFVRPIISLLAMPITCLTLGLFQFVIAGLMLLLVSAITALGFQVDGVLTAIVGAVVIAVVGFVAARIIPH